MKKKGESDLKAKQLYRMRKFRKETRAAEAEKAERLESAERAALGEGKTLEELLPRSSLLCLGGWPACLVHELFRCVTNMNLRIHLCQTLSTFFPPSITADFPSPYGLDFWLQVR